ncbi:MAG: hypothetical protein CVU54_02010 [Deltaproteobacteria bacterium HGW-Deltaproteobacteria-12]|jgi:hypothetical protein|nr:MAG: hypothetical protein CVU54_02010 [Deltaproteobacteria bacterium HGW-Deltaproteobacteria-12]
MPVFNFLKQFADKVERGEKRQTIRAKRRDGRNSRVGDKLYLYTGMRTKSCRKLGAVICTSVQQITIDRHGINIDGVWLLRQEEVQLAIADGFEGIYEMKCFFNKEHGLPFEGLLYKW